LQATSAVDAGKRCKPAQDTVLPVPPQQIYWSDTPPSGTLLREWDHFSMKALSAEF
jgi:hypothetical protein